MPEPRAPWSQMKLAQLLILESGGKVTTQCDCVCARVCVCVCVRANDFASDP